MMKSFALLLALVPALASAETISLSPAQVEAAKESGARLHARDAALGIDSTLSRDRQVHGEVGVAIGTGGASSVFGTVVTPLGDNGVAAISVAQENYGRNFSPMFRRRP